MEAVKLEQVTRWKKKGKAIFYRLDWEVRKGESVLIMGNSSSEKRELFKLLTGQISPQEGSVTIHGKKAVLYEKFPVLEGFLVKDYLEFILKYTDEMQKKEVVKKLLQMHGLWEKREYRVENLTLEEEYRLMFAMADAEKTDIIIMAQSEQYLSRKEKDALFLHIAECLYKMQVTFLCFSDVMKMEDFVEVEKTDKGVWERHLFSKTYLLQDGKMSEIWKE